MTSTVERMASDFTPGTPNARTTVTTAERILLSDAGIAAGDYVLFRSHGAYSYVRFGDVTVTVDHTTRNTGTPPATVAAANAPHIALDPGEEKRFRVPAGATYLSHISDVTTGVLRFGGATGAG